MKYSNLTALFFAAGSTRLARKVTEMQRGV
jgi:hypothetical protein